MKGKKLLLIIAGVLVMAVAGILAWHFCAVRSSANSRKFDVGAMEANRKAVEVHIHRYDQDLFSIDTNNLAKALQKLSSQYPEMLIGNGVWKDPQMLAQLRAYLTDPIIIEIYNDVQKVYPDLKDVENELGTAMGYYLNYFPHDSVPNFYALVPGLNTEMPTVYGYDNDIFVNLDMYLGKDYKYYGQIGMPLFISQRCDKKFLALDCVSKSLVYKHMSDKTPLSLLDYMIFEGKRLYFTEMLFPKAEEQDIIEYTAEKYQWAVENQGQVWAYIIEKDLLFSKQNETIRQFVEDNPFTKPFVNTSPGRMGAFLGWKIVQGYMENNPEVSLAKLMEMTDSQMILNKSGYKPKRR